MENVKPNVDSKINNTKEIEIVGNKINPTNENPLSDYNDNNNKTEKKEVIQQKDVNEMNDKELANYYKTLFAKSRKLILHYEEELKQLKNDKISLKEKLKEYESGKK